MIVGAAALAIGAVLPWISGSIGEFSTSRSGIDGGDGWFFVVGGALIALAAWQYEQRRAVVFAVVVTIALALLWVFEFSDIRNRINEAEDAAAGLILVDVKVGAGMWVMAFGAAIAFFGSVIGLLRTSSE